MKGAFFNKPLEWSIEVQGEAWAQGSLVTGTLKVKNHSSENVELKGAGVSLAHADIRKVHAKTPGAFKFDVSSIFSETEILGGASLELKFSLSLPENCLVTDKKASYYLSYGRALCENHLQLKVEPKPLYAKVISLMDTFQRFKLKEIKSAKKGVEFKLIPPTSRDMMNLETLSLYFSTEGETLNMDFEFQVKKLDTTSITTKVNKETVLIKRVATPKDYSLGKDMINQDYLLKVIEGVIGEVKLKSVF